MTYPALLAAGITAQDAFVPSQLYAGEADIVTDRAVAGATPLEQFRVVAFDGDGLLVPWNPEGGAANKALTFSGVGTDADTITLNGVVFTLKPAAANAHQVTIGGTAAETAANFLAKINAVQEETGVYGTISGAVVTIYAAEPGAAGNSIAISEASTATAFAGGATALSGGTAQSENKPVGLTAQPCAAGVSVPYFSGGVFNHEMLVWPASCNTLALRRAAFAGTNVGVAKLL